MTRRGTLLAVLGAFLLGLAAGLRCFAPPTTPEVEQLESRLETDRVAGRMQDTATASALVALDSLQLALAAERSAAVALRGELARLRRAMRPVAAAEVATVPDTCRAVVADLVEQVALRDSALDVAAQLQAASDSAVAAFDRVAAGLAVAAVAEQQLRHRAQATAAAAVSALARVRDPRLTLVAGGELPLSGPDAGLRWRAGADLRVGRVAGAPAELTYRIQGQPGEAVTHLVGLQLRPRLL